MITENEIQGTESPEADHLAAISAKVDFCMQHYQPYLRQDFNLHQLSVITNMPVPSLENWFSHSRQTFVKYLDEWRVKYAKNLMSMEKVQDMELKTVTSLSVFSSASKFIEAYKKE